MQLCFLRSLRSLSGAVDLMSAMNPYVRRAVVVSGAVLLLSVRATKIAATSQPDAKERIRAICHTESDDPIKFQRMFDEIEALGEKGRLELLRVANRRTPEAECALQYLVQLEDRRALPIVRRVLADPRSVESATEVALDGVKAFRDTGSFDRVVAAFRSESRTLRRAAAYALSALGDPRSLELLRQALTNPDYQSAQGAIVRAVGTPGHAEAVDLLLSVLKEPAYVQMESLGIGVVESLARIATERSRRHAVDLVPSFRDDELRQRLRRQLVAIFERQRLASRDSLEIASIDELITKLK